MRSLLSRLRVTSALASALRNMSLRSRARPQSADPQCGTQAMVLGFVSAILVCAVCIAQRAEVLSQPLSTTEAANLLATPASRTAAIISSGVVECTFEGEAIEDHFDQGHSFTYSLCRLSDSHRRGEYHARHLPAVHLVGPGSLGPHESPFEVGEELTLRLLPAAPVHADEHSIDMVPSWELEGIGATVDTVVSRRHTTASLRRLSHGAQGRCGNHNRCVGPRKLLTIGMAYTGESFCTSSPRYTSLYNATAADLWNWNFAPLGPAPPRASWSPQPDFGWYDALSTRFHQMCATSPNAPRCTHPWCTTMHFAH